MFFGDSATESWDLAGGGGNIGGDGHFVFLGFSHIEIFDAVEGVINIFQCFFALLGRKISLEGGFFVHEQSR